MNGFKLDARVCILLCILIFLVPLPWLVAWIAAVSFHEICHWSVVKLYGGHMRTVFVGLGGASMQCGGLSRRTYLLAILAGPVGGLLLVLLGRWLPRLAICSWLLSAYNLLPVLPLDGGQIMRILIKSNTLFDIFEKCVLILISALAVIACLYMKLGLLPLIVIVSLLMRKRKRPCKDAV